MTKHRSPADDLQENFTPSPIPAPGPDGMPLEDRRVRPLPLGPEPPRLCELGPCRHYHRMRLHMASADPTDGSPGRVHLQVVHYCYPEVGVETELTGVPVIECNRWDPIEVDPAAERRRRAMIESDDGSEFLAELEAFERHKDEVDETANAAADEAVQAERTVHEQDRQAEDANINLTPLTRHMVRIWGDKDLPAHDGAGGGPSGHLHHDVASSAPTCTDDCIRCKLQTRAMAAVLADEDDLKNTSANLIAQTAHTEWKDKDSDDK